MQDEQNLERVVLTFDKFNIPMADKQCNDGYLKLKKIDLIPIVVLSVNLIVEVCLIFRFTPEAKKRSIITTNTILSSVESLFQAK